MSKTICAALDLYGNRCHCSKDLARVRYHGDEEIYGSDGVPAVWVVVYLCKKHRKRNP